MVYLQQGALEDRVTFLLKFFYQLPAFSNFPKRNFRFSAAPDPGVVCHYQPNVVRSVVLIGAVQSTGGYLGRSETVIVPSVAMEKMYPPAPTISGTRGCRVSTSVTSVSSGTSLSTCVW